MKEIIITVKLHPKNELNDLIYKYDIYNVTNLALIASPVMIYKNQFPILGLNSFEMESSVRA